MAAGAPVVAGHRSRRHLSTKPALSPRSIGYPVLLKAVAGGGGKGMRRVDREADLESALRDASSEAERAFRNAEVYVEKLIERPRHIEIQLLGDRHGNMVHLGERECSIQRRHQKVIEECPSPLIARHPETAPAPWAKPPSAPRAPPATTTPARWNSWSIDDRHFYFLEMNTRLQVEHPVTELVTGLDLVKLQTRNRRRREARLSRRRTSRWRGSAIECRIYAEDPANNFLPFPGKITRLTEPAGPGVRLDGGVYEGWTVPMDYDPLLAKLAVWAATRDEAAARAVRALGEYRVGGIRTNIGFFRQILEDPRIPRRQSAYRIHRRILRARQTRAAAGRCRSGRRPGCRASLHQA